MASTGSKTQEKLQASLLANVNLMKAFIVESNRDGSAYGERESDGLSDTPSLKEYRRK